MTSTLRPNVNRIEEVKPRFLILITTDGTREEEIKRLFDSISIRNDILVAVLFQNDSFRPEYVKYFESRHFIFHKVQYRMPLSQARNLLLDMLSNDKQLQLDSSDMVLLLADDDCWYSEAFFDCANFNSRNISLFAARDPISNRQFSTFDIKYKRVGEILRRWEFMFYGVSIAIAIPYFAVRNHRFHPHLGLGNEISQGEESHFLFDVLKANLGLQVEARPDLVVYHPHKLATSSKNYRSLGYFLGWSFRKRNFSVIFFYLYLVSKYTVASVIKPKLLYWSILSSLLAGFVNGVTDKEKLERK